MCRGSSDRLQADQNLMDGPNRAVLLDQFQDALLSLVGLRDHRGAGLLQDVGAAHVGGLGSEVGIHDAAACRRLVLDRDLQVRDHRVEVARRLL